MSNGYAIAAVTAVIKNRLTARLVNAGVQTAVGPVSVSTLPPDKIPLDADEPTRINLFLHHVSANQGWRNEGNPVRDSSGARIAAPPLALDLHYLVTAYGAEGYVAEILLGHAMQELAEHPVLPRDVVREALSPPVPDPTLPAQLATSRLADQVEQIRIIPVSIASDEMSRLWTALQAQYRPTAAYQVGVVLIDSTDTAKTAPPVGFNGVVVDALRRPWIDDVVAEPPPGALVDPLAPVTSASTLLIRGSRLRGPHVRVLVGSLVYSAPDADVTDASVRVPLSALPAPGASAGVTSVQVVHDRDLGLPVSPHQVLTSNAAALTVRPTVSVTVTVAHTDVIDGVTYARGTLHCTLDPAVGRRQRLVVLLNEKGAPATRPARAYSLPAPDGNGVPDGADTATTVDVAFAGLATGDYTVRAEVDGAASLLAVDGTGRYATPGVSIS